MSNISSVRSFCEEAQVYGDLADKAMAKTDFVVLNGHNFGMNVCNGALHIQHGSVIGEEKEPLIYYRGTVPIRKMVILTRSGNISLDALYWCKDQGISLLLLDGKGNLSFSIVPENKDSAPLRRLQYQFGGTAIAIALLKAKTGAQYDTVMNHAELRNRPYVIDMLECGVHELDVADYRFQDLDYLRMYEARLAAAYFDAFYGLPLKWKKSDEKIVPPHWRVITERASPISPNGNARKAINPFHVALNYLYGVAEHQLLCAIHAVGLDPACGFLHADKENRLSLLYDLIEPHRAEIDDRALKFFDGTVLKRGDMTLFPSGQIALNSEFSRYLIASCMADDKRYTATVSWLVQQLAHS